GGAGRRAPRPPRCGRRAAGYVSPTESEQAQLARARGPLAPARPGLERLGALRLLGGRGLRREAGAAHRLPRRQRELVEAVVAVARVRRGVAAGLALGERAPDAAGGGAEVGGRGGRAAGRRGRRRGRGRALLRRDLRLRLRALLGALHEDLVHRRRGDAFRHELARLLHAVDRRDTVHGRVDALDALLLDRRVEVLVAVRVLLGDGLERHRLLGRHLLDLHALHDESHRGVGRGVLGGRVLGRGVLGGVVGRGLLALGLLLRRELRRPGHVDAVEVAEADALLVEDRVDADAAVGRDLRLAVGDDVDRAVRVEADREGRALAGARRHEAHVAAARGEGRQGLVRVERGEPDGGLGAVDLDGHLAPVAHD